MSIDTMGEIAVIVGCAWRLSAQLTELKDKLSQHIATDDRLFGAHADRLEKLEGVRSATLHSIGG